MRGGTAGGGATQKQEHTVMEKINVRLGMVVAFTYFVMTCYAIT